MSNFALRAKYLKEYNEKEDYPFVYKAPRGGGVFCKVCESNFVGNQKGDFRQHCNGRKHQDNKELKRKRTAATQALLTEVLPQDKAKKSR